MTNGAGLLPDEQINILEQKRSELTAAITDRQFERYPELLERFGEAGKVKCRQDIDYHLRYLIESVKLESPGLFSAYLGWCRSVLESRGIPFADLQGQMSIMIHVLGGHVFGQTLEILTRVIQSALDNLQSDRPATEESFIRTDNPYAMEAQAYLSALLAGDRQSASRIIDQLIEKGVPIEDLYEQIFQLTQYEVGRLWQRNEVSVGHEHFCTAATQQIMSRLYPRIFATEKNGKRMTACSVSDELHEIGIRMVADLFELRGWDTDYLGANLPELNVIEWISDHKPHLLAVSVTLPIHLGRAKHLIESIRQRPALRELKILAGGYPFVYDPDLWKKVGADGSTKSAKEAVELAETWIDV